MRFLTINGSARGTKGVTQRMLDAFCGGLIDGGAEVESVQVKGLKIAPCLACLHCMHKTPGRCIQRDDMDGVYEQLKAADALVLGAPVYIDGMSAQLKAVLDRCTCAIRPDIEVDDLGRVRHPMAWYLPTDFYLISTCGFPEPRNFEPLIATFRANARNFDCRAVAEMCVPGSIGLQIEPKLLEPHLTLLRRAGREAAASGGINPALLADINRPPLSVDQYRALARQYAAIARKKQEA